ncbi:MULTISPECIES: tyrosine-type recombinase/integrase [unclassified Streptomyces]|uniref:tyrosine-type recombinase/integrase n=1 Tax=unclassified Streptomyces TaxID=2593676 RepID=UPI002E191A91|nr:MULTISPECIES: tyrosine-type recombinase/integrase [unclassified Streptomyces]
MAATKKLMRGMGTLYKTCEHPQSRWSKCPHEYHIRYRNSAGLQREESGFATQDAAIERLTEIYKGKRSRTQSHARAERIEKYGAMRFEEFALEWKAGQRHLAPASVRHLDSLLEHHLFPALGSRKMITFDHKVVDTFIRTMERAQAGLATQANAVDKLRAILLDAHRLGLYPANPMEGVKVPQYDPSRAVIPSLEQLRGLRTAGDDAFMLLIDMMSGCGLRNGEAAAVNLNNIVADDVYRVSEQVVMSTRKYGPLKHRKAGEYRDVPLPARIRSTVEWYAEKYGTTDGYLLRQPTDVSRPYPHWGLWNQWQRIKAAGDVNTPEGMVVYGFRHFFASNCLGSGIPITDVAEWMGHKSIDVTFKIYRHLMPGSIGAAAKVLDMSLAA